MEYSDFLSQIREHIFANEEWAVQEDEYKFYPDGFEPGEDIRAQEFVHNTNVKYHGNGEQTLIGDFVTIKRGTISMRFSVQYLFERYEQGGWGSVDEVITEHFKMTKIQGVDEVMKNVGDYEKIKDRLIIRPINFTDSKYDLKVNCYRRVGDIALVLYVLLYDTKEMGLGTFKLPKSQLEEWGKDEDEVWESALNNTNIIAPPRLYDNPFGMANPPYEEGAFMAWGYNKKPSHGFVPPTITTTRQKNGAIAMFYYGVFERLGELMEDDYYVVFTSIDDVHIHRVSESNPRTLLSSLKSVNKEFNEKEDILSRKVFIYERGKKELRALEL